MGGCPFRADLAVRRTPHHAGRWTFRRRRKSSQTGIARLRDDLVALLPEFQSPPFRFGAAEVIAWADPAVRRERGKPFAPEALLGRGLEYAAYWSEPDSAPPSWDMEPLETGDVELPFASLDPGFEDADPATSLPSGWSADPPGGPTVASRAVVADAHVVRPRLTAARRRAAAAASRAARSGSGS